MKRTVTRWVSKARQADLQYAEIHSEKTAHFCVPVEVTGDDGQPEPERCPCDSEDSCCQYRSVNSECCSCHRGSPLKHVAPCLSPFHKKPAQKCKCAGFSCCGNEDVPGGDKHCLCCSPTLDTTRFQIITCKYCGRKPEPVKEMGLYEACEAAINAYSSGGNDPFLYLPHVRAAFNRERAARERGRK